MDELAKYRHAQATWDTLVMAVRLPPDPRIVVTTTPRPIPIIKSLMADPSTHVTKGTIYENRDNLSEKFFNRLIRRYEGTYLGQQELEGQLISDRPGARVGSSDAGAEPRGVCAGHGAPRRRSRPAWKCRYRNV